MISSRLKEWTRQLMQRLVVPTFGRLGVTPNMLTLIGLLLTIGVAIVIADGRLFLGGWLILGAGIFDLFDGALARATGQQSSFGAFFDSTIDRYSDAIIFGGLLLHYQAVEPISQRMLLTGLVFAATVGSLLVSYTRARGEALGYKGEFGLLGRPERIILLAAGLLFGWDVLVVWVLAIFTNVTASQRIIAIWQQERQAQQPAQQLKLKPGKVKPRRSSSIWPVGPKE